MPFNHLVNSQLDTYPQTPSPLPLFQTQPRSWARQEAEKKACHYGALGAHARWCGRCVAQSREQPIMSAQQNGCGPRSSQDIDSGSRVSFTASAPNLTNLPRPIQSNQSFSFQSHRWLVRLRSRCRYECRCLDDGDGSQSFREENEGVGFYLRFAVSRT